MNLLTRKSEIFLMLIGFMIYLKVNMFCNTINVLKKSPFLNKKDGNINNIRNDKSITEI